jgi:hypothetical protein
MWIPNGTTEEAVTTLAATGIRTSPVVITVYSSNTQQSTISLANQTLNWASVSSIVFTGVAMFTANNSLGAGHNADIKINMPPPGGAFSIGG